MNSLWIFVSFGQKSNSVLRRYSSSRTDRIKLLNYTTKALYGPVIKPKALKSQLNDSTKSKVEETTTSTTSKKCETDYSSEIYWAIGNRLGEIEAQNNPKISGYSKVKKANRVFLKKPSKEVTPDVREKTVRSETLETFAATETIEPCEDTVAKNPILLTNEELRNILHHPLQNVVLTTSSNDLRVPKFRNVPSVGRILQHTMSESARNALLNWKLSKIRELGEQGFADLQQSNLNSGFTFHWSLQNYFQTNQIPTATSSVFKLWESVRGVLDTFSAMPEIVEKPLFHPTLKYKGVCDCVSEVENQLTVIEWKKSTRSKGQGMIVVAYENGKQADVYKLNEIMLRKYWRLWLGRLQEFWIRSRDGTLLEPI